MTRGAAERGKRVLILVHRQELLMQSSRSLTDLEVPHGLIAPGRPSTGVVDVASVQTLDRRLRKQRFEYDFIIIDEAHHAVAATWKRILAAFPEAHILGVTATPVRTTAEGLGVSSGGIFDDLVIGPTVEELVSGGFLVEPEVYAPPVEFDLTGIRKRAGDFVASEVAKRVDKPTITGSAVDHYKRLSPGEPAIAFCASIAHAEHVASTFREAGFSFAVIHGGLGDHERRELISGLASGRVQGLTSVDLISEGTDIPVVSVGILLRPTQSLGLYLQQVGRVLRPAPGKSRALILDHVASCLKFGLPTETFIWSLDGVRKRSASNDNEISVRQCKKCFAVFEKSVACPFCGHTNTVETRKQIQETDGELKRISKEEIERARLAKRREERAAKTFEELLKIERERNYKPGWAHFRWAARQRR